MKIVENETLHVKTYKEGPRTLGGYDFRDCYFDGCVIGPPKSPEQRWTLRDVSLTDCKQFGCFLFGPILEEITVQSLGKRGTFPLFLWGVVMRHVTLSGKITAYKLNAAPDYKPSSHVQIWLEANADFYQSVDWALDISKAQFTSGPEFHFIPGSLVRRDPATQVLVRRDNVETVDIDSLPWNGSCMNIGLRWFLDNSPYDDVVLAAPTKAKYFASDMAALDMLRARGIAEKD